MKSGPVNQIIVFLLVLFISSFDRHISTFFPLEMKAMIESNAIPAHGDLPGASADHHEDVAIKTSYCSLPFSGELPVKYVVSLHLNIPGVPPCTIWQPPESIA